MLTLYPFVVNAKKYIIYLYKMSVTQNASIVDNARDDCYISNTA